MDNKNITVTEALRFARHDFMNQLQLIRINLELGRPEDAKKVIDQYASRIRDLNEFSKLGLPMLYEWVQTAPWRFPALNPVFQCQGQPADESLDKPIVEVLSKLFDRLNGQLTQYEEIEIDSAVIVESGVFKMELKVTGELEELDCATIIDEHHVLTLSVENRSQSEWLFIIKAR